MEPLSPSKRVVKAIPRGSMFAPSVRFEHCAPLATNQSKGKAKSSEKQKENVKRKHDEQASTTNGATFKKRKTTTEASSSTQIPADRLKSSSSVSTSLPTPSLLSFSPSLPTPKAAALAKPIPTKNTKPLVPRDRTKYKKDRAAKRNGDDSIIWEARIQKVQDQAELFDQTVKASTTIADLARLEKIVNSVSITQDRDPFDMTGPLTLHLRSDPELLSMLLDIADMGTTFKVEDWGDLIERVEQEGPEAGDEEKGAESSTGEENFYEDVKESTTSSHLPSVYLRRISGTVEELVGWSKEFVKAFPHWEAEELAVQKRLEKLPATAMASRSYAGVSSWKKGWERDLEDLDSKDLTRYSSFVSLNQLQDRVQHYQVKIEGGEWLVSAGAIGLRESIIIQELEEVIIAVLGVWRLNAAYGRLRSSYSPRDLERAIRDSVNSNLKVATSPLVTSHSESSAPSSNLPQSLSEETATLRSDLPLLSHSECQAVKETIISLLQKHSLDLNRMLLSEEKGASDKFLETWLFNSTTLEVSPDGKVKTAVHGLSDVTREELDVSSRVEFHNARNGNTAFSDKQLQGLARNISSPLIVPSSFPSPILPRTAAGSMQIDQDDYPSPVSPASTLIARQYGCFFDLFGMSTDHKDVGRAIYYWLRHLRILGNRIVSLNSSQLGYIFTTTDFMKIYQPNTTPSSPAFKGFFEQCDSSSITELFRPINLPEWNKMEMPNFIEEKVGTMVVKQLYPEEDGWVLFIHQIHPGIAPYHASLAPLLHRIRFLVALLHQILISVQSRSPISTTKAALQDIVDQTKLLADSAGLTDRLEAVKLEYCGVARVLLSKAVKVGLSDMFESRVKENAGDGEELDREELESRVIEEKKDYYADKGSNLHRNNIIAIGVPDSKERRAFIEELLLESTIPCPTGINVATPKWREWIQSAAEGLDLTQSAKSTGRPHPSSFYPSKEDYHESRKASSVKGKLVERNQNGAKQWGYDRRLVDIAIELSDPSRLRFSVEDGRGSVECLKCHMVEYGSPKKLTHRCSQDSSIDWRSLPLVLCSKEPKKYSPSHLLYPYQILDTQTNVDAQVWTTHPIQPLLISNKARLNFANSLANLHGLRLSQDDIIFTLKGQKEDSELQEFMMLQVWSKTMRSLSEQFREGLGVNRNMEEVDVDPIAWAEKVTELLGKIDFSDNFSSNKLSPSRATLQYYQCSGHVYKNACIVDPLRIGASEVVKVQHTPHTGFPSTSLPLNDCVVFTYSCFISLPPPVVMMVMQAPFLSTGKTTKLWKAYDLILRQGFRNNPEDWISGLRLK